MKKTGCRTALSYTIRCVGSIGAAGLNGGMASICDRGLGGFGLLMGLERLGASERGTEWCGVSCVARVC